MTYRSQTTPAETGDNGDRKPADDLSTLCWCGEPGDDLCWNVLGRSWCHAHAPRCRSGAHFHGNCQCIGQEALARKSLW